MFELKEHEKELVKEIARVAAQTGKELLVQHEKHQHELKMAKLDMEKREKDRKFMYFAGFLATLVAILWSLVKLYGFL